MNTYPPRISARKPVQRFRLVLLSTLSWILFVPTTLVHAQQLGWEGETGVFVTPLAYTIATPAHQFALPVVAYHFLNAGSVIGSYSQLSITSGYAKRVEFGYTRSIHAAGSDPTYSPLWTDGFNTFHAKGSLITENAWKQPWMPQVSAGFMLRTQVRNVGGEMQNKDTTNADIYLVATKTITQLKPMSLILSAGVQGTNAELLGLGGNASQWGTVGFGAVAFVFAGPAKSAIILGAEVAQQPRHPDQLPNAVIRTAFVYALRVVPSPKLKLNLDFGILEGPGQIETGVDLKAKDCPGGAISYAF
jgi:hypothetical protein